MRPEAIKPLRCRPSAPAGKPGTSSSRTPVMTGNPEVEPQCIPRGVRKASFSHINSLVQNPSVLNGFSGQTIKRVKGFQRIAFFALVIQRDSGQRATFGSGAGTGFCLGAPITARFHGTAQRTRQGDERRIVSLSCVVLQSLSGSRPHVRHSGQFCLEHRPSLRARSEERRSVQGSSSSDLTGRKHNRVHQDANGRVRERTNRHSGNGTPRCRSARFTPAAPKPQWPSPQSLPSPLAGFSDPDSPDASHSQRISQIPPKPIRLQAPPPA